MRWQLWLSGWWSWAWFWVTVLTNVATGLALLLIMASIDPFPKGTVLMVQNTIPYDDKSECPNGWKTTDVRNYDIAEEVEKELRAKQKPDEVPVALVLSVEFCVRR